MFYKPFSGDLSKWKNANKEKYVVVIDEVDENPGYNAIEITFNNVSNTYDI